MNAPDAVVVGAGITGLTCAYRLRKLGFESVVLESSSRIGGVIRSERSRGYLLEWGPNSLLPTGHTFRLFKELNLDRALVEANPRSPRYIVVNRRLQAVPFGPIGFRGIARALAEPFVRSRVDPNIDESVAGFFRRRFGPEVHDRLVAPFVTGIFAGDTEVLSAAAVFPRMVDLERQFGSVIIGAIRSKSGGQQEKTRRGRVSTFAGGMETLPQRLSDGLNVQKDCSGIRIGKEVRAKATVLAVPAYRAAEVIGDSYPELARLLSSVDYAPIVVAAASVAESSLRGPLRGFGFLVPRAERLNILGTVFSSVLFPDRAPEGRILLTSFLGGALKPEVFDWPDQRIWEVVCSELKLILKTSLQPEPVALFRHRRAIPQYNIGHKKRVEAVAAEVSRCPGLFVTGNFLRGVSVSACMEEGDAAASAVAKFLGG